MPTVGAAAMGIAVAPAELQISGVREIGDLRDAAGRHIVPGQDQPGVPAIADDIYEVLRRAVVHRRQRDRAGPAGGKPGRKAGNAETTHRRTQQGILRFVRGHLLSRHIAAGCKKDSPWRRRAG
jgi:hypothetical protein